jgi:hypothetical protein
MGVHNCSIVVLVLLPLLLASSPSAATDFDFFYHVQQVCNIIISPPLPRSSGCLFEHNESDADPLFLNAVAWVVVRHEGWVLLPGQREASGGLRHPRPLAQLRRVPPRRREEQDGVLA